MKVTIVEAIQNALEVEMKKDKRVVVLGEDVGVDGGVFRATKGLTKKFPKRVLDTPLAEAGILATSFGMTVNGLRPVPEIQFSGFIYQGYHHIEQHIARIRNRSRGTFTCPLVIRSPYGGGIHALEHHSESRETIYCHTPGLKVVVPSNPYDAKGLLIASIRCNDPVMFLEPKRIYRSIKQDIPEGNYEVPLGKAKIVKPGKDVTIIGYGAMIPEIMNSIKGIDAEVIDLRTLSPLDMDTVLASVKKTGRCIVVHEAAKTCGLAAEISAQIMEKALVYLLAPVIRVTGFDVPYPLFELEKYYMPSPEKIKKAIDEVMKFGI